MTTIKSMFGMNLDIDPHDDHGDNEWVNFRCQEKGAHETRGCHGGRLFKRADLLAALDATANTDVKHRADAYEAATRAEQERDEYRLKAVVLDAERDEWKARAEDAEAFGAAAVTRAEKAEAAIQRVRDVRNEWSKTLGRSGHVVEIDDALADKPAFKQVILTSDLSGVHVNGYDFTKGVLTKLPADDADRLIGAGLAREAS